MITLEEATKIAKDRNPRVDTVQEYADAYEFFIDDGVIRHGGAENSFMVEKTSGSIIRWPAYFMSGKYNVVEIGEPKKI